jgi:hypothetical protein
MKETELFTCPFINGAEAKDCRILLQDGVLVKCSECSARLTERRTDENS